MFDPATVTIVRPQPFGPFFLSYWVDPFAIEVLNQTATTLDLRLGVTNGFTQDVCKPTADWLGVDASTYPAVTLPPQEYAVRVTGTSGIVEDVSVSFTFDPTADRIGQVQVTAVTRTDWLGEVLLLGDDPAFCEYLAMLGVACVACPSGTSPYCMNYEANGANGFLTPGLSLVPRTLADIEGDPACR